MGGLVQKIVEKSDFSARVATHHPGLTQGGVAERVNARDGEEAARDPRRDDLQNANGRYPPAAIDPALRLNFCFGVAATSG